MVGSQGHGLARRPRWILLAATCALAVAGCADRPRGVRTDPAPAGSESVARELPVQVLPGDSWDAISERVFGDASRAARIAADNTSTASNDPSPGTRVIVHIREDEVDRVRRMGEARDLYNAGVEQMKEAEGLVAAREAFERALDRAPYFVDARYNLGLVLLQLEEPAGARPHLQEVAGARPRDKDARYGLAAAHFHTGDYARSITELEAALRLDPDFLRARWTHALALQRSGRIAEARRAWDEYLERDRTSSWADQARRHLAELGS
jgi:tetratricopeptide (TPR) repeat protein